MSPQRQTSSTHKKRSRKPSWDDRFYVEPMPDYNAVEDENCPFTSSQQFMKHYAHMKTNMELQKTNHHRRRKSKSSSGSPGKSPYLSSSLGSKTKGGTKKKMSVPSANAKVLSSLFDKYKKRVLKLWDELNVPTSARDEFADYYFEHPSLISLEALADEIQNLLEQRVIEADVEKAISSRETHLEKLHEMILDFDKRDQDADTVINKERFSKTASELRTSTLEVVEIIHEWRRFVRDGRPYMWKGHNYLAKIASDISFIDMQQHAPLFKLPKNSPLNPFLVNFGRDSSAQESQSHSRTNRPPGKDSASAKKVSFMKRIKTAHRIVMQEALSDKSREEEHNKRGVSHHGAEETNKEDNSCDEDAISPISEKNQSHQQQEEEQKWHDKLESLRYEGENNNQQPDEDGNGRQSDEHTPKQEDNNDSVNDKTSYREDEGNGADANQSTNDNTAPRHEDSASDGQRGNTVSPDVNEEYEDDFESNEKENGEENTNDAHETVKPNLESSKADKMNDNNHYSANSNADEQRASEVAEEYDDDFEDEHDVSQKHSEGGNNSHQIQSDNVKEADELNGNSRLSEDDGNNENANYEQNNENDDRNEENANKEEYQDDFEDNEEDATYSHAHDRNENNDEDETKTSNANDHTQDNNDTHAGEKYGDINHSNASDNKDEHGADINRGEDDTGIDKDNPGTINEKEHDQHNDANTHNNYEEHHHE